MRMNQAHEAKSTLERIQQQVERMQGIAERNLRGLADGSAHFDSSTSTAVEMDKLAEKFTAQLDALKKMDYTIAKLAE